MPRPKSRHSQQVLQRVAALLRLWQITPTNCEVSDDNPRVLIVGKSISKHSNLTAISTLLTPSMSEYTVDLGSLPHFANFLRNLSACLRALPQ